MKDKKKKDLLLLTTKLIEKIPDATTPDLISYIRTVIGFIFSCLASLEPSMQIENG